jgi:hypothetical protein
MQPIAVNYPFERSMFQFGPFSIVRKQSMQWLMIMLLKKFSYYFCFGKFKPLQSLSFNVFYWFSSLHLRFSNPKIMYRKT